MDIAVNDVTRVFHPRGGEELVALDRTSATITSGEFVALVGPSGCGKTTLLDIVAGLLEPSAGEVYLDGVPGAAQTHRPGMVFQRPVLLPWRTAIDNVLLPSEVGSREAGVTRSMLRARARSLLDIMGLGNFERKYPDELSGGMQQRVAIARALLLSSSAILMDEPFSALDEFTREQMNLELLKLWERRKFTTVFVTHNILEAVFLSTRVLVMTPRPGRVVADVPIDLPRPRTRAMIASEAFTSNIRAVRSALDEHWNREGLEEVAP